MAEVSVAERNLLGRGLYAKGSVQYGQYAKGFTVSFVEPYFLGYRVALGLDIFAKQQSSTSYVSYQSNTAGFSTRLGFALREDLGLQVRYSLYRQSISLPDILNELYPHRRQQCLDQRRTSARRPAERSPASSMAKHLWRCVRNWRKAPVFTSAVGYSLTFNTLDNNKNPTMGTLWAFNQDFAGVGGDVNYIKTTTDARMYTRSRSGRHRCPASARRLRHRLG